MRPGQRHTQKSKEKIGAGVRRYHQERLGLRGIVALLTRIVDVDDLHDAGITLAMLDAWKRAEAT